MRSPPTTCQTAWWKLRFFVPIASGCRAPSPWSASSRRVWPGLTDRGRIDTGQRADLVRVRMHDTLPVVRQVWRAGERVA